MIADYFCLSNTSEEKVLKIITNIESSKPAGVDKLFGRFSKTRSALCNLSISQGVFPSACKVEKLKPIFKTRKKTDPSNCRPISLLPSISKIIERIIHDQTNAFYQMNLYCITINQVFEVIIQQIYVCLS